jgi:hypothetical protein
LGSENLLPEMLHGTTRHSAITALALVAVQEFLRKITAAVQRIHCCSRRRETIRCVANGDHPDVIAPSRSDPDLRATC